MHCLVEKPFTLELARAEELVALAAARGLVLEVVQNYRFEPVARGIADALQEERLGRICTVAGRFHRDRPCRDHEAGFSYPLLFIQAIHHLDWLQAILPAPVESLQALHGAPPWSSWRSPSVLHLLMRCSDGVLVSYQGSYNSRGDITPYGWPFRRVRTPVPFHSERLFRAIPNTGRSVATQAFPVPWKVFDLVRLSEGIRSPVGVLPGRRVSPTPFSKSILLYCHAAACCACTGSASSLACRFRG